MRTNVLEYLDSAAESGKLAFSSGDKGLTFHELYSAYASVGSYLCEKGYDREPVVVFMPRKPETIAAFFGVIAAGCFYVPVDGEMPRYRIELIFKSLHPRAVICDESTEPNISGLEFDGELIRYEDISAHAHNMEALREKRERAIDTDCVYIVFTSGSTGIPKGVAACHRSVIDYIENLYDVLRVDGDTVFGSQTPLYVDACLKELYPTLKAQATTYLIPKELFMFPVKLVEYLNEHKINTVCWVASALTLVSGFGTLKTHAPRYLRTIAFGSEVFPVKQYRLWREALPEARFINLYGPTEATGMSCYYEITRELSDDEPIPIGKPFRNTGILLLTEENTLAAEGETGEICIRGTALTLGYYNNPEKTSEAFTQNPLQKAYPELIYRTGDLARCNGYGELVFVSRKDSQIKHMGHRIELGEIEAAAGSVTGIAHVVCVFDPVRKKIKLYYDGTAEESGVMLGLKEKLPRYMLPNKITRMDALPLTPNGKLDRKTLGEIE